MGKKMKKPGKGKEKTERTTVKAEEKKAHRETKKISLEDDIDTILLSIQKEEAKKKEVHIEENVAAPSPQSNYSLNINPLKEMELILSRANSTMGTRLFCTVIFTGIMSRSRNGSWFQALIARHLVVLIKQCLEELSLYLWW
ncbi:hypothetical protein L1049_020386 [Liquidambar formosana]|uniref:Uncharacterized protein n=1 Tax=Liquidambar formosana TaxID=63359 RepID=A0AAP0S7V9_LIQFO